MKTICFAHGKESGPRGRKIDVLGAIGEARGWRTVSPDFRSTCDPDRRVAMLLQRDWSDARPLVLVGSSMGGYGVTVASETLRPAGLFLLAPAFYLPSYRCRDPHPVADRITVVHGWRDEVVPASHAIRFAERFRARLHLLDDGHTLRCSIPIIGRLFGAFLDDLD